MKRQSHIKTFQSSIRCIMPQTAKIVLLFLCCVVQNNMNVGPHWVQCQHLSFAPCWLGNKHLHGVNTSEAAKEEASAAVLLVLFIVSKSNLYVLITVQHQKAFWGEGGAFDRLYGPGHTQDSPLGIDARSHAVVLRMANTESFGQWAFSTGTRRVIFLFIFFPN